jgi:arylsulfate sulfotransferase
MQKAPFFLMSWLFITAATGVLGGTTPGKMNVDDKTRGDHLWCPPFCRDVDHPQEREFDDNIEPDEKDRVCPPTCEESDHDIRVVVSPRTTAIASGGSAQFTALTNDKAGVTWSATVGTIDAYGNYVARYGSQSTTATVTATSKHDPTKSASATIHVVAPGQVSATSNAQVALYSIFPGAPGKVSVQFGPDTTYELTTWTRPVPPLGGSVSLFVAGMKPKSTYHLRGIVQFSDGAEFIDADQTFAVGALPPVQLPAIVATTTAGMAPQPGVELLDLIPPLLTTPSAPVVVADLSGNILWTYYPAFTGLQANPVKLLPNGNFLINFSGAGPDGVNSVLQEVDLAGELIWQMTAADLNEALAAATCAGCNITAVGTHHDFELLPNGHLILIASTQQTVSETTITGDVVIDLDQNRKPVWLWNAFDHLDLNRRPMGFPDWTHANAIIYSAGDGNLIVSSRHQNWLIKIDYANGTGSGNILWRLGYQGDFALVRGTEPNDWFYAQHGPSIIGKNNTGNFMLTLFDNGDDRVFPPGVSCGTAGEPACFYSTVPVLEIDETAKTATLVFNATVPSYSFFGGNAAVLSNGNLEYCDSAGGPGTAGDILELSQQSSPQTVWKMLITGQYVYRGQRIPSLYPEVQW